MSTSSLERHDLEQDIDELRSSIESLESSRTRLRDVIPAESGTASGSIWSNLTEIVTDFFQVAGEALTESGEEDEDDNALARAEKKVKKAVTADWSGALGEAFSRLRDRVAADIGIGSTSAPPVAELSGVIGELDAEIGRLNAELQRKLDRAAELDRSLDDSDTFTPVTPHRPDVADTDSIVVRHDDDIDVTPIPVDVLPDVDPAVVPDNDADDDIVLPTPHVDDIHVDEIVPTPHVVVPDIVVPDPDEVTDTITVDDTPAYVPGNATEIGELDGAIYDVNEILANGRTVADLRKYDVPAGVVMDAGVSASALLDGGYSVSELHEAGVQPADLHGLASAGDMRGAGYTAGDLHGIYSVSECADAFSTHELRDAGFSVSDFHGVLSAGDLRESFSVGELRTVYSISELHAAGFDAADLNSGGVSWSDLANSGFTLSDLENAGASESTLREIFPQEFSHQDDTTE